MGSPLRLTVVGVPEPRASAAWEAVSAAFEELEQALSRFRPTSDLVTLNRRAGDPGCSPVHARLYEAVATAERAWRRTDRRLRPAHPRRSRTARLSRRRLPGRGRAPGRGTGGPRGLGAGGTRGGVQRRPLAAPRAAAAGPRDRGPDRPRRDRQGPRAPVGVRDPAGSAARDRERRTRRGQRGGRRRCGRRPAARRRASRGRRRSRRPGRGAAAGAVAGRDRDAGQPTTRSRSSRSTPAPSAPRRLPSTPGPRPTGERFTTLSTRARASREGTGCSP